MPNPEGPALELDHIHQSVPDPIIPQPTLRLCYGDTTDHVMLEKASRALIHRKFDVALYNDPSMACCEPEDVRRLTAGPKLEYAVTASPWSWASLTNDS